MSRERILEAAREVFASADSPTITDVAAAARVSPATVYRHFGSRRALLRQIDREPGPSARDRILRTAIGMVGESGLRALSMDVLAARAGVSRAALYRIFPGKAALFVALVRAYSPLEAVAALVADPALRARPPDEVMPAVARAVHAATAGAPGMVRTLFAEVAGLEPEAQAAVRSELLAVLGGLLGYVSDQMDAGRLRRMPPLVALQGFVGPLVFHVLTRPIVEPLMPEGIDTEAAMVTLAETWVRGMRP